MKSEKRGGWEEGRGAGEECEAEWWVRGGGMCDGSPPTLPP